MALKKRTIMPAGPGTPRPGKAKMKPGSIVKGAAMGAADGTKRMQARMAGGYARIMGGIAAKSAGRKMTPPKPVGTKRKPPSMRKS